MSIDVFAAAQRHSDAPHYTDRTWLAVEMAALIERADWEALGGLAAFVALVAAPLARGLAARVAEASVLEPRTAAPAWSDPAWLAAELAAHAAALTAPDSDMQPLALRMAGAVARVEISP